MHQRGQQEEHQGVLAPPYREDQGHQQHQQHKQQPRQTQGRGELQELGMCVQAVFQRVLIAFLGIDRQ